MRTAASGLALAGVFLSPAALLAFGPLLLVDGTRGLWVPLVLAGGAGLVALLLGDPWARVPATPRGTVLDLVRRRWPAARLALTPLALGSAGSAFLFLWAQLAAVRELARTLGWSPAVAVAFAAVMLGLAAWREVAAWRVAVAASAIGALGSVIPVLVVVSVTEPAWPRVWGEVASRPRVVFSSGGAWVTTGRPVRGAGSDVVLVAREEQRLTLLGRGPVRVDFWEGGAWSREVRADIEVILRPGDRLVAPDGFRMRFQAGRTIPGAPASGPEWLDPPGPRVGWRALVGIAGTLLVGALGLAPVHAALPAGRVPGAGARLGAVLVALGAIAAMAWSLYAAWLVPEVYTGGVVGAEVYDLPAGVGGLGAAGPNLATAAVVGLAAGAVAAALLALLALPRDPAIGLAHGPAPVVGALVAAGVLALAAPAGSWPVLVAAFGLAASVSGPAAVLTAWGERPTASGLATGASLGLVVFGLLTALRVAGLVPPGEGSWLGWLAAWPALLAVPANLLAAWLLSPGLPASPRSPLPPGLAELHAP